MLYWVSYISNDNLTPKLVACSVGCMSLVEAIENIRTIRHQHIVLSAWIDTFEECDKKTTVFHKCYINAIGKIDVPLE